MDAVMFQFAILLLATLTAAVTSPTNQNGNLTLTFSPDGLETCALNGSLSGSAVAFTTRDVPNTLTCYNLNETFIANVSASYAPYGDFGQSGANWATFNGANFDPTANYSRVWFQQINLTGQEGPGKLGQRSVFLYPHYGCLRDHNYSSYPSIQYTCQSDSDGECNTVPYSVQSFSVESVSLLRLGKVKCADFVHEDAATGISKGAVQAAMTAIVLSLVFLATGLR